MKNLLILFILLCGTNLQAQEPAQFHLSSESRVFFDWSKERSEYLFDDKVYNKSRIVVREINSRSHGYIIISLIMDGDLNVIHGSITEYKTGEDGDVAWYFTSTNSSKKNKLFYDTSSHTITFFGDYDESQERYTGGFVFEL